MPAGRRAWSASLRLSAAASCATLTSSSVSAWARLAMLCRVNRSTSANSSPCAFAFDSTDTARIESPPTAKKLSWMPTRSRCSTCAQMAARRSSIEVRGATYCRVSTVCAGRGSALRSILPFAVSGKRSSATNAAGSMKSGSVRDKPARSAAVLEAASLSSATKYATSRFSPGSSSRAITRASRTPGKADNAASISPSSIRKPRIFTCVSMRPRYSSVPSGRKRARSPLRYSLDSPSSLNGLRMKRRAVNSGWFR